MVAQERRWSWAEFGRLPFEEVPCDIHCVTKWSKLATSFRGVSVDVLLDGAEPQGAFAMAYSFGGYTTNVPLEVSQRAPGRWQLGTVTSIKQETSSVKSFRLRLPMWMAHLPGQHYDVRLTAADGYTAQRSYSVASSPLDEGEIELTVDRLADGEVSPYFHDVVGEGDQMEVRGPFASYFVWRGQAPVLLVGGGRGWCR